MTLDLDAIEKRAAADRIGSTVDRLGALQLQQFRNERDSALAEIERYARIAEKNAADLSDANGRALEALAEIEALRAEADRIHADRVRIADEKRALLAEIGTLKNVAQGAVSEADRVRDELAEMRREKSSIMTDIIKAHRAHAELASLRAKVAAMEKVTSLVGVCVVLQDEQFHYSTHGCDRGCGRRRVRPDGSVSPCSCGHATIDDRLDEAREALFSAYRATTGGEKGGG